jgi:hypothetical protein
VKRCGLYVNATRDCAIATWLRASATSWHVLNGDIEPIYTVQPFSVSFQDPKRQ